MRRLFRRSRGPVYVVAGYKRSGTTMLMQALEAGGMKVDRAPEGDPERDDYELSHKQRVQGWYSEREDQFEELPVGQRFPSAHKGHVIKCLVGTARYCDPIPEGYVVVFINRDAPSINRSAEARWGYRFDPAEIRRKVNKEINIWTGRVDCPVRLIEVHYDDIVLDPVGEFTKLKAFGFPINVRRAANVVRRLPTPIVARLEAS